MVKKHPLLYLFLLFLTTYNLQLGSQETNANLKEVVLKWEAAPANYLVEIKQENRILYKRQTKKNEIRIDLAPGIYEYRVSLIDPFDNIVSSSDWTNLEVIYKERPIFRVINPSKVRIDMKSTTISIQTSFAKNPIDYFLIQNDKKIPVKGKRKNNILSFKVNPSDLGIGDWDMLAISPEDIEFTFEDAMKIVNIDEQTVFIKSTKVLWEVPISDFPATIEVKGEKLDENLHVEVKNKKDSIPVRSFEILDENTAFIHLITRNRQPGLYTLILTNSINDTYVHENGVKISKDLTTVNPNTKKPRFELHFGIMPMLLLDDLYALNPEWVPIPVIATLSFGVLSGSNIPFIGDLGIQIEGGFGLTGPSSTLGDFDINILGSITGFWKPKRPLKTLSPLVTLGIGVMWVDLITGQISNKIGNIYVQTGLGLSFIKNRRSLQFGVTGTLQAGELKIFPTIGVFVRTGFIL